MAERITSGDLYILEQIAKRYEARNIIGQSRQITGSEDADKAVRVIRKVVARCQEIGTANPEQLRDLMARAMCPEEWAEYDAGKGVCSNMAGWAVLDSIKHASRAYRALFNAGVALPEPPAPQEDPQ